MTTFTHKGVEFTLGASGKFTARTKAGLVTAASLDAIKKKLDKPAEFEPFKAFTIGGWSKKEINECSVTGIVKGRGRYKRDEWQTSKGPVHEVYADTPENRAAAQTYIDMLAEHVAIRAAQDEAQSAASGAIVSLRPGQREAA